MLNFDHNATAPLCSVARQAWLEAVDRFPGNPASPHRLGSRAEKALEEARQTAAELLKCSPPDMVWTSGATEANNAVFHHAAATGEAWISAIEHPSVIRSARRWFGERMRYLPVTPAGVVDLDQLSDRLKASRPSLVAVMAANNETGILQPWREALRLCRKHDVPFLCDAAQWIGKLPASGLGEADFVTGCAHKFGGPTGVGFLKVPLRFRPLLVGGEQEDGRRAGTPNTPGVLAMIAAWQSREQQLGAGEAQVRQSWRDVFVQELLASMPEAKLLGEGTGRLWNTAAVLMPPADDCRKRWVVMLDRQGFAVSTGSACASGKEKLSHVVKAMGYDGADRMLRFSSGWETREADWKQLAAAVLEIHARVMGVGGF